MILDKELYRQAREWYREWDEYESYQRALEDARLSPVEAWRRYAALWEFVTRVAPEPNEYQHKLRMAELEDYYERMKRFEAGRRERGSSP